MALTPVPLTNQLDWLLTKPHEAVASPGLPLGYAAYLKVLPPLGIDSRIPITTYSFAKRTIADLNARAAFWDKYAIRQGQPLAAYLERTTYRAVGTTLGLPYTAALDSAAIQQFYGEWPPHLGSSPALEEAFLQQIIHMVGPEGLAYFYGSVAEGTYHWDAEGFPQDWLEQGVVADLLTVYQRDGKLPTYVFAPDYSWCLYQAEDVDWLVIGGSAPLAQALLHNSGLETFLLAPVAKDASCGGWISRIVVP